MATKTLPDAAYLRERLDYNPANGVLTWKERPRADFRSNRDWNAWNARYAGSIAGSSERIGSQIALNQIQYKAHRLAWKIITGREPPNELDHKNRNATDNRWANLREATRSQNQYNKPRSPHLPLPKGVQKLSSGRYRAVVCHNSRIAHLGVYDTPEQAHEAYCAVASKLHGEFFNSGKE